MSVILPEAKRIGIFGGSFDPVHNAHVGCARCAIRAAHLDELVIVPTFINPFKLGSQSKIASPTHRLKMCELLAQGLSDESCAVVVSDFEISQGQTSSHVISYSVGTLEYFAQFLQENQELYFILGSDAALGLPKWHESEKLVDLASFIVVKRPGVAWTTDDEQNLKQFGFKFCVVDGPKENVYSTDVRNEINAGRPIKDLVPIYISEYIRKEGLYI